MQQPDLKTPSLSQKIGLAFLLLSIFALQGCLKNQPSDNAIKAMVAERFDTDFNSIFTTTKVTKNNGYKKNETNYVADVTITATAQQSLDDYARGIMQSNDLSTMEKVTASMTIGLLKLTMPEFKAGDTMDFNRHYLFIDTDNGWMLKQELKPNGEPLNGG